MARENGSNKCYGPKFAGQSRPRLDLAHRGRHLVMSANRCTVPRTSATTNMHGSNRSLRSLLSLGAALVLMAAPLRAQGPSAATSGNADVSSPDSVVAAGPTMSRATVGVRHVDDAAAAAKAAPAAGRGGRSNGQVLMIVGGAAIITGIVVSGGAGYAISIAGAVIGLYGLYEYLQ